MHDKLAFNAKGIKVIQSKEAAIILGMDLLSEQGCMLMRKMGMSNQAGIPYTQVEVGPQGSWIWYSIRMFGVEDAVANDDEMTAAFAALAATVAPDGDPWELFASTE